MTPIFSWHKRFKTGTRDDFWEIQKAIEETAREEVLTLIDLHTPLYSRSDLFPDAVHPSEEGAAIIAKTVLFTHYRGILGDSHFHRCSQTTWYCKGKSLSGFSGKPIPGEQIKVAFAGNESIVQCGPDGIWSAEFEPMGGRWSI